MGLIVFIALLVFGRSSAWWAAPENLVLFGLLVISPLAFGLTLRPDESTTHLFQTAVYLQPFAALISGAAFLITEGVLAGTLAIAWAPVSVMLAMSGLIRLRERKQARLEELSIDVAFLFLPVTAYFLWAERMSAAPFGLGGQDALTLARHAFFAGFAALTLLGLSGRFVREKAQHLNAITTVIFLMVVGSAILLLYLADLAPVVRATGSFVQTAAYAGLAYLMLREVAQDLSSGTARFFILFSVFSIVISMSFLVYGTVGTISRIYFVPDATRLLFEGWLIAIGFAGCGLIGFGLARGSAE